MVQSFRRLEAMSSGSAEAQAYGEALRAEIYTCLLYTSDAADERSSVDLGGRRIIKKKNRQEIGRARVMYD